MAHIGVHLQLGQSAVDRLVRVSVRVRVRVRVGVGVRLRLRLRLRLSGARYPPQGGALS